MALALLSLVIGFISQGWLTWKAMDAQAERLGRGVIFGKKELEKMLATGKEMEEKKAEDFFGVASRLEKKKGIYLAKTRVSWKEGELKRAIELATFYNPDCPFRGSQIR